MEVFYVIGFMVLCVGLFVWSIDRAVNKSNREEAAQKAKIVAEIAEIKFFHKIVFVDSSGNVFETKPIKAQPIWYREWTINPSADRAQAIKRVCFEHGFFTSKDGVSYPVCNILNVKIVEEQYGTDESKKN